MVFFQYLDVSLAHHPHSKGFLLHEISLDFAECDYHNPWIPCILVVIDPSLATKLDQLSTSNMILGPMFPDKEPCPCHQLTKYFRPDIWFPWPNYNHFVTRPSCYSLRTSAHVKYHPHTDPPQYHSPISHNGRCFRLSPPAQITMDYGYPSPESICTN